VHVLYETAGVLTLKHSYQLKITSKYFSVAKIIGDVIRD